jgi:hypothetical protein|tara:strand:+ start:38 stop:367 length:330 start_codon:yes stop_codon:yes gene_type:complete
MNKTLKIITFFITLLLLNACASVGEGLAGSKKKGNEEFLVEKKAPLVLPPSFGELPEPGMDKNQDTASTKADNSSFKKIVDQNSSTDKNNEKNDSSSSIEESIIEKINE